MNPKPPVIGVVGACAAGKSTLVGQLRSRGYQVRHIAQEHSFVPDMWRQIAKADVLIYLDVTFEVSRDRTDSSWSRDIFNKQIQRLAHARENADLTIETDDRTPEQVLELVLDYFRQNSI